MTAPNPNAACMPCPDPATLISTDTGNLVHTGTDGKILLSCTDVATCGGGGTPTVVTGGIGTVVTPVLGGYNVTAPPSAAPGNLITTGPDGLAFLNCAAVAPCGGGTPTALTAGPGIILTGDGTPATPYDVSALSASPGNVLTEGPDGGVFLDCAALAPCGVGGGGTVVTEGPGATVTGTGTGADPYEVSVVPSTDVGNLITAGTDGKLFLDCADVAACGAGGATVVTAGPGATVTGTGAGATPYVVSVVPSTEVGNILGTGPDGNLSITCADIAGCVVVQDDPATPEIEVTGAGTPGNPYIVRAVPTPRARVRTAADFPEPERVAGGDPIEMGLVTYDVGAMFNAAQPTRLTVPANWDGVYSMGGNVQYRPEPTDSNGFRSAFLRINGTDIVAYQQVPPVTYVLDSTIVNLNTDYQLVPGDYVELLVQQGNGVAAAVPVAASAQFSAALWLTFLHS